MCWHRHRLPSLAPPHAWQEVETLLCSMQPELVPEAHKIDPFCSFWVLTHFLYGAQCPFVPSGPAQLTWGAGAAGATAGCCCQRVSSAKNNLKKSHSFFPACSCKHPECSPGSRALGLAGWEQPVPAGPGSACSRCGGSSSIRPRGAARPQSSCRRRQEQGASPGSVVYQCCNPPVSPLGQLRHPCLISWLLSNVVGRSLDFPPEMREIPLSLTQLCWCYLGLGQVCVSPRDVAPRT